MRVRRPTVHQPGLRLGPALGPVVRRPVVRRPVVRGVVLVVAVLVGAVLGAALGGCTDDDAARSPASGGASPATVRLLLASSLAGVAPDLVRGFERARPGTTVEWSAAASSALVAQVRAGADADVVVTADRFAADEVAGVAAGAGERAGRPVAVASNRLVLAVPSDDPGRVRGLGDLSRPELLVGLCAPQVPCGRYARDLLRRAGVRPELDTEEPDARSLVSKIASGDLDAGIVYATDVRSAGSRVRAVPMPPGSADAAAVAAVPVEYVAVPRSAAGRSLVRYLRTDGQPVLRAAGFGPPAPVGR